MSDSGRASEPNLGPSHGSTRLPVSSAVCWLAYISALATAGSVAARSPPLHLPDDPLWKGLWADLVATATVFVFSFLSGNSSIYDPYWTIAPQALTLWWLSIRGFGGGSGAGWPQYAAAATVWIWACRFHALVPWPGWTAGLSAEDWRYADLRRSITGAEGGSSVAYWAVSSSSFHLTPTLLVFFCLAPVGRLILEGPSSPLPSDRLWAVCAVALTSGAIAIEALADEQLKAHRRKAHASGETGTTCSRGLWRYSRHPNYFGEVAFHLGLFAQGWANGVAPLGSWLMAPGIVMVVFFRFASLPLMDKRSLERRRDYAGIMATTSSMLLWPNRHSKVQ